MGRRVRGARRRFRPTPATRRAPWPRALRAILPGSGRHVRAGRTTRCRPGPRGCIDAQHDRSAPQIADRPLFAISYRAARRMLLRRRRSAAAAAARFPDLLAFASSIGDGCARLPSSILSPASLRFTRSREGRATQLSAIFRLVPDQVRIIDVPVRAPWASASPGHAPTVTSHGDLRPRGHRASSARCCASPARGDALAGPHRRRGARAPRTRCAMAGSAIAGRRRSRPQARLRSRSRTPRRCSRRSSGAGSPCREAVTPGGHRCRPRRPPSRSDAEGAASRGSACRKRASTRWSIWRASSSC